MFHFSCLRGVGVARVMIEAIAGSNRSDNLKFGQAGRRRERFGRALSPFSSAAGAFIYSMRLAIRCV
jgi:hypothetical protein